jgi:sulfide:quinone oxidoreductase
MNRGDDVHVLIAGGGVAALEAALALRSLAAGRLSVELVAPEPHFWYRPVAVAEPFGRGEVRHFELARLASDAGASFTLGELSFVDAARSTAYMSNGAAVPFTALLIACGAEPIPAVPGALTFRGPADTELVKQLLAEIEDGTVRRVAFAAPAGAVWSLPVYELALMTAAWLEERGIEGTELALVSPESEPLHLFGPEASDAVQQLLARHSIALHMRAIPAEARPEELLLIGGGVVPCDRVVALPRLQGRPIAGVPQTFDGFVPVDDYGRVTGLPGVYAAGDVTTFPVKQGGIAAQQAEAAADAIAADAGLDVEARPFRPVLRGMLLTGSEPRFLHAELSGGASSTSWVSTEPLWWPPAKIVGRYLSPFLAELAGAAVPSEPPPEAGVRVEVELEPATLEDRRDRLMASTVEGALAAPTAARVGDVMASDLIVVAPEDTLGEVAERMSDGGVGSVLVTHYGKLIGILTSRDMLRAFAARMHPSEARVRGWMTAEPITVSTRTTLEAAALLMTEHGIHHLPVVDGERPIGLVRLRDVVRAVPLAGTDVRVGLGF